MAGVPWQTATGVLGERRLTVSMQSLFKVGTIAEEEIAAIAAGPEGAEDDCGIIAEVVLAVPPQLDLIELLLCFAGQLADLQAMCGSIRSSRAEPR